MEQAFSQNQEALQKFFTTHSLSVYITDILHVCITQGFFLQKQFCKTADYAYRVIQFMGYPAAISPTAALLSDTISFCWLAVKSIYHHLESLPEAFHLHLIGTNGIRLSLAISISFIGSTILFCYNNDQQHAKYDKAYYYYIREIPAVIYISFEFTLRLGNYTSVNSNQLLTPVINCIIMVH